MALVIGNSKYAHATPLQNPHNDAAAVVALLERFNFDVDKGIDLTHRGWARTIGEF